MAELSQSEIDKIIKSMEYMHNLDDIATEIFEIKKILKSIATTLNDLSIEMDVQE